MSQLARRLISDRLLDLLLEKLLDQFLKKPLDLKAKLDRQMRICTGLIDEFVSNDLPAFSAVNRNLHIVIRYRLVLIRCRLFEADDLLIVLCSEKSRNTPVHPGVFQPDLRLFLSKTLQDFAKIIECLLSPALIVHEIGAIRFHV